MTDRQDTREMTEAQLDELARGVAQVDPSTVPAAAVSRVLLHNRRVLMLEALLRRARLTLETGSRIEPELADTIRFAARALRARTGRLAPLPPSSEP